MSATNKRMTFIRESDLSNMTFPECVCPYLHVNTYMLAEINTGRFKSNIRIISNVYSSLDELLKFKYTGQHRFLHNHLIYSDATSSYLQ